MANSMTAFGRAVYEGVGKAVTAEIKSVNSRYLDCTVKLPRAYSFLEERVRALVASHGISRGKLEIFVSVDTQEGSGTTVELDCEYAKSYAAALEKLAELFSLPHELSISRLAQNKDMFVIKKAEADAEADWELIRSAIESALVPFCEMRKNEGQRLIADLREKKNGIALLLPEIKEHSKSSVETYRERLGNRIKQILADNQIDPDEQRLLTECAVFADRVAIDEEIVRLESHFEAFEAMAAEDGPIGRKMDFLIQEMNREINTIGSKSNSIEITKLVITVKGEIEKIREQVQNIE